MMKKKPMLALFLVVAFGVGLIVGSAGQEKATGQEAVAEETPVYQLRTYHAKPGKLEVLHERFRDETNAIFKRNGIRVVAYWTPLPEAEMANTLVYIVAFKNRAAADQAWDDFKKDPEWIEASKRSKEKHGKLLESSEKFYMTLTDYSPSL